MILGFYTGASGVLYNEQKLGVISNNLANMNGTSFHKAYLMLRSREENPHTKWIDSSVKERLPSTYGIERKGVYPSFEPGALKATDNPFNVAIAPELRNAFFAVKKTNGDPKTYYTRNGQISYKLENPNDPNSQAVLHVGGHRLMNAIGESIPIDPSLGPINITPNGTLQQADIDIGEIPIFRMNESPNPTIQRASPLTALIQKGDSLYEIPPKMEELFNPLRIEVGQAGVNHLLHQGSLEGTNVNVMSEYMDMINTTRASEANFSSMRTQGETLTKLFQIVRG